jgi:hypothetical protein
LDGVDNQAGRALALIQSLADPSSDEERQTISGLEEEVFNARKLETIGKSKARNATASNDYAEGLCV